MKCRNCGQPITDGQLWKNDGSWKIHAVCPVELGPGVICARCHEPILDGDEATENPPGMHIRCPSITNKGTYHC